MKARAIALLGIVCLVIGLSATKASVASVLVSGFGCYIIMLGIEIAEKNNG